jgi:hypothetical protein
VICTSNVESGHFGLQGRRPTMEDFVREWFFQHCSFHFFVSFSFVWFTFKK